ncbi:MAG: molybdopterin cofactor-binding domain-containing protein [Bacteroidota bacterium]
MKTSVSRRRFLRESGIAGGGLIIGLNLMQSCVDQVETLPVLQEPLVILQNGFEASDASPITDFLQIRSDGNIFLSLSKYEMGQGVSTGLSSILAEELEADWEKVNIKYVKSSFSDSDITGGSTSTLLHWDLLRKAGAFAKQLLIEAAAREWSVYKNQCLAKESYVYLRGSEQKLSYGELASKVEVPENYSEQFDQVALKYRSKFKLVGKSLASKIIPDIITGKHPYSIDVRLPGMKYAAVLRCPVFHGKLLDFDSSDALKVPGVEKVVPIQGMILDDATHIRDGVAVIANTTWAAFQGTKAIKAEWDLGERAKIKHDQFVKDCLDKLENKKGTSLLSVGKRLSASELDQQISYTYEFPYQHHVCMEPLNATAHFKGDSCEMWVGTQSADKIIADLQKYFDLAKEQIKIHCHPSGGGFGLRYSSAYALESMVVSEAAGGELVKMCYSREDDVKFDYLNPFEINKHTFGIKDGKVVQWEMKSVMDNWGGLLSWLFYDIPNRFTSEIKVNGFTQVGPWRSVMANAEGFSTECFVDEVAHELGRDPLEFRLSLLPRNKIIDFGHSHACKLSRMRGALELVAQKAEWGKSMPEGSGQGIAVYPYMHGNGYGAAVVEVATEEGEIKVKKVTTAIDCGLVVNPNLVKQQMEGGVIWALSAIFYGGAEYELGVATRSNFHDNKVLRINEVPEIEVYICENDEEQPWGVGEIAGPVIYPATCNAIFAATGERVRKLPYV